MPNRILANNRPLELSPRAFSALLRFQRPAFLAFEPRQCRELCHGVQGLWAQLAQPMRAWTRCEAWCS